MSKQPAEQTLNYLVQAKVIDHGQCDSNAIRKGIQSGIAQVMAEGMLTSLDDETTEIQSITTTKPSDATNAALAMLGEQVEQSEKARQFLEYSIQEFQSNFAAGRKRVLTAEERETLLDGLVEERISWEANEAGSVLGRAVRYGCDSWFAKPDAEILEDVLFANPSLNCQADDEARIKVFRIFSRSEVWNLVKSVAEGHDTADLEMVFDLSDFSRDETGKLKSPALHAEAEKLLPGILEHINALQADQDDPAGDKPAL